jgi:hypothetical protein
VVLAYLKSFRFLGKPAKFDAIVPTSYGSFNALVDSQDSSTYRFGIGDPAFRVSLILLGAEAASPQAFRDRETNRFKLGALFRVRIPVGEYNPTKLINLGTNRFAFKTGLAASYDFSTKLIGEVHLNSWFFTENKEFFNGNSVKQKPLVSLQAHLSYQFKPGFWAAVSYGKSHLGETVLNGVEKNDLQNNSRTGIAFAHRLNNNHSLKIAATTGVSTRYGSDYTTVLLAYQFLWFDKPK